MNNKHKKILKAIFNEPVSPSIAWRDIEALFKALDAHVEEGAGSRVLVELKGVVAVFHRPHPQKETDKGAVKSVRRFLLQAEVKPC